MGNQEAEDFADEIFALIPTIPALLHDERSKVSDAGRGVTITYDGDKATVMVGAQP